MLPFGRVENGDGVAVCNVDDLACEGMAIDGKFIGKKAGRVRIKKKYTIFSDVADIASVKY